MWNPMKKSKFQFFYFQKFSSKFTDFFMMFKKKSTSLALG